MNILTEHNSLKLYRAYRQAVFGESPELTPSFDPKSLDQSGYNFRWSKDIGLKLEQVDKVKYIAKYLTIHIDTYNDKTVNYFIDSAPFTCATFTYQQYLQGIQFVDAWNHHSQGPGMCRWLIFNYYLLKHPFIVSDVSHTPEGKRYWEFLVFEGLKSGNKISVLTPKGEVNIQSVESLDDYYNVKEPGKHLFKVYAK